MLTHPGAYPPVSSTVTDHNLLHLLKAAYLATNGLLSGKYQITASLACITPVRKMLLQRSTVSLSSFLGRIATK